MRIGQLAAAAAVSRDTIRFYERRGLLQSHRGPNGYREFPDATVDLLACIRRARNLGFSLAEIADRLPHAIGSTDATRAALVEKIAMVNARIAGLHALRDALAHLVDTPCPLGVAAGSR